MYHYVLRCDRLFSEDIGSYVAYGLDVLDETHTCISTIRDITTDKAALAHLVELCNSLQLSPVHIHDVVEDFVEHGLLV